MEKIEYREATFEVIRTLSCERTRVKDAANNYLHTHWEFTVEVHWQPALVSYKRGAVAGAAPIENRGEMPGETDLALLTRLLQPRGLLRVTAGDSVILETPAVSGLGRMPCDVKGGPSCDMVGVPLMIGIKHWVVVLHFVADVRDLGQSRADHQEAVISNIWVSTEDVDFQRRSTRRFAGRAILRADVMRQQHINANTFRDLYLFPQPRHYQRQNVHVQLSEDGTTLDWSFEDVMQGYDKGQLSPILKIECFRTGYVTAGSPFKIVMDTARTALQAGIDSPISTALGVTSIPAAFAAATLDNLPKSYIHCRCDIIGDRNADLGKLTVVALGVCMNQVYVGPLAGINFNGLTAQMLSGTAELIFRQDIADQVYTSVELTIRWTDDAALLIATSDLALELVNPGNARQRAFARATSGSIAMIEKFCQNSQSLVVPDVPVFNDARDYIGSPDGVVAARDGWFSTNPPMIRGAFGSNIDVPPPFASIVGGAGGVIPNGIEKLIVQALLGQGVAPPPHPGQPGSIVNQS